jgi:hypothetical protein
MSDKIDLQWYKKIWSLRIKDMADGAIGYLETDEENLKIFDAISAALKPGGKHLMGVCNGAFA